MGVYLSEPETKKSINTGAQDKMRFVSGEMQGTTLKIQDGARIWRTRRSTNSTLVMVTHYLLSSMAMEVSI